MENFVITIARQYGSGGRTVGKMLAEKLGVSFYDKQIIQMASDESGIDVKLFGQVEEGSSVKASLFNKTGCSLMISSRISQTSGRTRSTILRALLMFCAFPSFTSFRITNGLNNSNAISFGSPH